jgi:anti-sigma factor RsiW
MNCKKVLPYLHAYVDGEAAANLMRDIEEHLGACPECRGQAERIRGIDNLLDSLTVPPLPREFATCIMAEAQRRAFLRREKKSFFPLDWQPFRWLLDFSAPMRLAACGAVLLACLLGMFMSREISGNGQPLTGEADSLEGFEWFSPTPPASLGSAYVPLAFNKEEDQGA